MSRYKVYVEVSQTDTVWVDADSAEEALAIVNADDFTYDHALNFEHDLCPGIVARHAEQDEE